MLLSSVAKETLPLRQQRTKRSDLKTTYYFLPLSLMYIFENKTFEALSLNSKLNHSMDKKVKRSLAELQ